MGLHWLTYQMDINISTPSTSKNPNGVNRKKMVPVRGEIGGKWGDFIYNYIYDVYWDLEHLVPLKNLQNICGRMLLLINLLVVSLKNTPLKVFLTSYNRANGPKLQNITCSLLHRQQLSSTIYSHDLVFYMLLSFVSHFLYLIRK